VVEQQSRQLLTEFQTSPSQKEREKNKNKKAKGKNFLPHSLKSSKEKGGWQVLF
jgi:hypothetical protein